jgi:hypothetical protein
MGFASFGTDAQKHIHELTYYFQYKNDFDAVIPATPSLLNSTSIKHGHQVTV